MRFLNDLFLLDKRNTTVGTEAVAGATTFLTMSYIVFVQPAVLSMAGMDFGAVMVATCISSGLASILMAFLANYPIALAPAMGHNFFFALTVCGTTATGGFGLTWNQALAAVFLSGSLFLFLSLFGFREKVVDAIPESLRYGLAVGIGLLIAMLGLQWGGVIVDAPGVLVGLGDVTSPPVLLTAFGTLAIMALTIRKVRGAILWGIMITTVTALPFGLATFHGILSTPPSISPTMLSLDFGGLFAHPQFLVVIAIFFFLDLFDSVGTLIGLASSANLLDEKGKLPGAEKALAADAGGTVVGALLGTSTVTSYIESASGISAGGRTGLASLFTGLLFFIAIFFYPLAQTIGGGYEISKGVYLYPIIAPALIVVGSLMLKLVKRIDWDDAAGGFSAYITIIITPLSLSITEGISAGFICYSALKIVNGQFFAVHPFTHLLTVMFILRYVFL